MRPRSTFALLMIASIAVGDTACTPSVEPAETVTSTVTTTRTARPVEPDIPPASSVTPLPPGAPSPVGERDAPCPYIRTGLNQDPTTAVNVADLEGNRIYRTTILTRLYPVGCRFYFINPPYQATADIEPHTYAAPFIAHDEMVRIAEAGRDATSIPRFADGADGILFKTPFDGSDAGGDWAFVFAKGRIVVVVHTEEPTISASAEYLAAAVVAKF